MLTLILKIKIRDPLRIITLIYYFIFIFLHYLVIGKILPKIESDLSIHLKHTETLISSQPLYKAYPYIGFHIVLSTLYILFERTTVYQIAGLLVFVNLLLILTFYNLMKNLFSSAIPAFFATLLILSGNLVWIRLIPCIHIKISGDASKCFYPFECLLFNSRYNISNYLVLQIYPFTLSFTLICLLLSLIVSIKEGRKASITNQLLVFLLTLLIYLIHPLYATLLPHMLGFTVFILYYTRREKDFSSEYFNIPLYTFYGAGFIPTLIAYLVDNVSQVYRFQVSMFSISNAIMCLGVLFFLKKLDLIVEGVQRFSIHHLNFFKYLLSILLFTWVYGLYLLYFTNDFDAWQLTSQSTPIWLYPTIIGVGPLLIVSTSAFVRDPSLRGLSLFLLSFPFLFIIVAPLIDYINFYLFGFYIEGSLLYSGVTSGRMLSLANLLYSATGGIAMGYAVKRNTNNRYVIRASIILPIIFTIPNLLVSLRYWSVNYDLSTVTLR